MAVSRRNSALKYFVNGRRAKDLHGITGIAGAVLDAFDDANTKAFSGLQRRAGPIARRAVRDSFNVKAGALTDKFRVETGQKGRRGDRDEFISLWASTREIPLLDFGGRWGGRKTAGAVATIERGGTSKTYGSSFIATIKGRRAIRVRSFDGTGRRHGRGPVRMLRGPSPFAMLSGIDGEASRSSRDKTISELTQFHKTELRRLWRVSRSNK